MEPSRGGLMAFGRQSRSRGDGIIIQDVFEDLHSGPASPDIE